jgi:hypothetical protein
MISSAPVPLRFYSEKSPRVDLNIRRDGKPQVITSYGQKKRIMQENGVEEAGTGRHGKGRRV